MAPGFGGHRRRHGGAEETLWKELTGVADLRRKLVGLRLDRRQRVDLALTVFGVGVAIHGLVSYP